MADFYGVSVVDSHNCPAAFSLLRDGRPQPVLVSRIQAASMSLRRNEDENASWRQGVDEDDP